MNNTPFVRYKHYTDEAASRPLIASLAARHFSGAQQGLGAADMSSHHADLPRGGWGLPSRRIGAGPSPLEGVSLRRDSGSAARTHATALLGARRRPGCSRREMKLVALAGRAWRLRDTVRTDRAERLAASEPTESRPWRRGGTNMRPEPMSCRWHWRLADSVDRPRPRLNAVAMAIAITAIAGVFRTALTQPGGLRPVMARGYALFVENGKLVFLVRTAGEVTQVMAPQLTKGAHTAVARLGRGGALSLALDGKPAASGQAPSLIATMPVDGLEVGSDQAGLVGPYSTDNQFRGRIESVRIVLD